MILEITALLVPFAPSIYNPSTMTISEIRAKYLKFFSDRGHAILPSASLVPDNDPTTLFTGSGMQPMISYLLGEPHPCGVRIADSQKCFRSQDINEVGDNRHTTFFEMLGNWSLGDYFKNEQIAWMFEFLTKELLLDPLRLYVTVFRGNDSITRDVESVELWKEQFHSVGIDAIDVDFAERDGMQNGRIFYYDEKKNWWSRSGTPERMPVGEPGGPDTEMFWDFEPEPDKRFLHEKFVDEAKIEQIRAGRKVCHVNCDCGRFVEIGNNVFMQYVKAETGFEELKQRNVDFGGGLERIAAATNNNPDIFLTDVFNQARKEIRESVGKEYNTDSDITLAYRVVLDHIRAATFLIGDGILPSNKDQGYFVRRLIRRAVRFSRGLSKGAIVTRAQITRSVSDTFIQVYKNAYPFLEEKRDVILEAIELEETKFAKTIEQGLKELNRIIEKTNNFTAEDGFNLYQSYGFPIELTLEELARSHGRAFDTNVFYKEFEKHRSLSRAGSEQKFKGGLADTSEMSVKYHTATHLLHKALRIVLGESITQKGSNITPERLRFDFPFSTKLTDEQIKDVEGLVNKAIEDKLPVHFEMLTLEEAMSRGAIGLFADRYAEVGDKVKVYFIGDEAIGNVYSKEVCGGPHVANTSELGEFQIQKEESIGSGLRRIKAILT